MFSKNAIQLFTFIESMAFILGAQSAYEEALVKLKQSVDKCQVLLYLRCQSVRSSITREDISRYYNIFCVDRGI